MRAVCRAVILSELEPLTNYNSNSLARRVQFSSVKVSARRFGSIPFFFNMCSVPARVF